MKRTLILSIALVAILSVSNLFAQPPQADDSDLPNPPRAQRFQMWTALDLTAEQQTQIDKLRLEHQKEMTPLRDEIRSLRSAYRLMIIDDKVSESALKKQAEKISEKSMAADLMRAKHHRQVRNLLTDEQKVKFDQQFLAKKGNRGPRGAMDGNRPGKRPGGGRRMR